MTTAYAQTSPVRKPPTRELMSNREFQQITTATSTTAAGSKKAPKWRNAHAWKWPFAVAPNPTTWKAVFWRSRYYVSIKVDSSPIFYHRLFFTLSRNYSRLLVFQWIRFPCVFSVWDFDPQASVPWVLCRAMAAENPPVQTKARRKP